MMLKEAPGQVEELRARDDYGRGWWFCVLALFPSAVVSVVLLRERVEPWMWVSAAASVLTVLGVILSLFKRRQAAVRVGAPAEGEAAEKPVEGEAPAARPAEQGPAEEKSAEIRPSALDEVQINFFTHAVELLVMSLEGDMLPMSHLRNVARYADMMSRQVGLSEEERRQVHFAALLHDIGMVKIPRESRGNPNHFKLHPALGAQMVSRVHLWQDLVPAIRYHHENYDGTGYPDRLREEEIPLFARILSIAESFDAMTNTNTYRLAVSLPDALEELKKEAGKRYDPGLVDAFGQALKDAELVS
ncbi:MAG: HD domain-containing protein [Acidobacteria bacterium]|nr:HD domain-containing protein [Acidobacteriota bacterium]